MWWLLIANTISAAGNTFAALAIPWFVLSTTGSAARMGVVVAVGTIPVIVVGIFGGAVIDRFGYRATSVVSDIASAVSVLAIPLLHRTVGLAFWQLLALVLLGALLDAPGRTARRAMFPELAELARIPLDRANALFMTAARFSDLVAPPLAGILIAVIGAPNLLWIDAATFVVSAVVVRWAVPALVVHEATARAGGMRGYLAEVAEGFRFLRSREVLFWMLMIFSVGSLVAEPIYSAILPVYAREVLKSSVALGFIFSALGIGSLVGNALYVWVGPRVSRSAILYGGFGIRALAFAVMLFTPPWWVIAAAIFVGAVALEPINPMSMSVQQEQVPPGMRGRVFGVYSAIGMATSPVGILVFGFLMDGIGMRASLVVFVVLNLLLPVWMAMVPALYRIERPEPSVAP
jgi:MFS family permease